ncbi:MAG: hypothetical protein JF615_00880, partial [Asticcacaulis sp.]|nr:hypothetical protein [Asticcacaulis sp.]
MNRRQILATGACALAMPFAARADDISQQIINKPEDGWTIYGPQTNKVIKDKGV